jgi:hypothetical protein
MGSHLSIGKLPYKVPYRDNVDVAHSNMSAQFTTGTEIILSINELETLLNAQHIFKKLAFRDLEVNVREAEWLIANPDNEDEMYDEDAIGKLNWIREKLLKRYYSPDMIELENSKSTLSEILEAVKVMVEIERKYLEVPAEHIKKLITWAKEHFVEGEHYLYTL